MAKIDRYSGNMKAFAAEALSAERTIFGDTTQSDTLDDNITADFLRGWEIVGVNENPTKQDFNGLAFTLGQLISYLHQRGIAEWNTAQEYFDGSVVTTDVGIYRLKVGGDGSSDPDTDGGSNWELAPTRAEVDDKADQDTTYTKTEVDGLFVNLTGDQDVDGVKTFTISPIVPTPTVGTQSANKQYVDGLVDPVPPITGTATFTNTTNNIALPGIGSIGLEVGDVVQVTGTASNSKLFSVEVITDSGNVIVNQAHAGGTTTKSLVNETVSATVTLLAKWYNAAAGLGQGWVKPARSASVLYTNNTGRLVFVIVSFNAAVSGGDSVEVDGVRITESVAPNGEDIPQSFTVPSGSTYEAFSSNFLNGWAELR